MTDDLFPPEPPDQLPASPEDAFNVQTFDTGAFEPVTAAPKSVPPASDPDEFKTITVEPYVSRSASAPHPGAAPPRTVSRPAARSRRRQRKQTQYHVWFSALRSILAVAAAAVLVSTIFSLWTRPTFFSEEFRAGLSRVQATQHDEVNIQPTPLPTDVREVRIGIIAGHSGPPEDPSFAVDPGAVCDDGLTELEINKAVAQRVVIALQRESYSVDLLYEFDPRLEDYHADVLVSIHANDCQDYGDAGTGYAVASASSRQTTKGADERLLNCIITQYGATTGLPQHTGMTRDMTNYHTFSEVSLDTPTAIIEVGFMRNDRAVLTQNPDLIAQGIVNGIRCFLQPNLYSTPGAPETPSAGETP
jgi:N-acetylmuramoyl-L-alanine amidase